MASLLDFLFTILIIYGLYKWFTRPKYRIRLTDPVTGYIKYLFAMDGINHSIRYTSDSKSALIFKEATRAERFASAINDNIQPEIEVKKFIGWKSINQG